MCGILAIINNNRAVTTKNLVSASAVIRHRGPDDEGFLTWNPGESAQIWCGNDTADSTRAFWKYDDLPAERSFKVGFGHRRLSIIDLSPAGHQPMVYEEAGLGLIFNGEIYNYLEVKEELEKAGHRFKTVSDTEVILHAWEQWGVKCMDRFNGMFAFIILDYRKQELYAVRDRFGVKPLYYYKGANALYLASEIKQIRTSPDYKFELDEQIAKQFLATGITEHTENTFDWRIKQLPCGHFLRVNLAINTAEPEITKWYTLKPKPWNGSFEDAAQQFRQLLTDAVKLRLRSDVTVGSCLSGGLDSSSIVCLAADLLKAKGDYAGQETVTACYENARYDEWNFAQEVITRTNAHPHRVFPSFDQLREEMAAFLWHQDEPVGSTSVFSQWAVFKATHEAGLKVMIDGQGADEQLAGYGGNDVAFYSGLMRKARFADLLDEAQYYKKEKGTFPKGFLLSALQLNIGKSFSSVLPGKLRMTNAQSKANWVINDGGRGDNTPAHSLQENLLKQIYREPLPALLRYEDHNSMAWSVESRTPFMDYRLVEFNLGLPERFVYKRGIRKHILREAMHNIIPPAIENRKDKMGFVTPEELWLKGEGRQWFNDGVDEACKRLGGYLLDTAQTRQYVTEMMDGKRKFDFMPWRIVCFEQWFNKFT
jgi:asparagine synthase (glutamine-hydrolysing)